MESHGGDTSSGKESSNEREGDREVIYISLAFSNLILYRLKLTNVWHEWYEMEIIVFLFQGLYETISVCAAIYIERGSSFHQLWTPRQHFHIGRSRTPRDRLNWNTLTWPILQYTFCTLWTLLLNSSIFWIVLEVRHLLWTMPGRLTDGSGRMSFWLLFG